MKLERGLGVARLVEKTEQAAPSNWRIDRALGKILFRAFTRAPLQSREITVGTLIDDE